MACKPIPMRDQSKVNGPICKECEIRPSELGFNRGTKSYYKKSCKTCRRYPDLGPKKKQVHCSICLVKFHPIALDVDHIDGNKKNNSYKNLQIICSNCHRLKSLMCHDWSTFKKD